MSTRADVIVRRTYARPLDDGTFEDWNAIVYRVVEHQKWLWSRALGRSLNDYEILELTEFGELLRTRKATTSGRTLWLGGTDVAKTREASQFNCSFLRVETVHDVVDGLWLLLQGCGVGFEPITGTLSGFTKSLELESIRSTRTEKGGNHDNTESVVDGIWTITIGDSAEAWCKSLGKILAGKQRVNKLIIDYSQIRPAGERLKGYGWISSGDAAICRAYESIVALLNARAGQLLTKIDILDVMNWMGTILSSRRSAEICLLPFEDPEADAFIAAKNEYWVSNPQRVQSNNSVVFDRRPSKERLTGLFNTMVSNGGSEPGFINAQTAKARAPWFAGCNPCAEILLGNRSFCNLVEINLAAFTGDWNGLMRAIYLMARANYRQTLVNFHDGILQDSWHENQEFLRLCGVGLTGIAMRPDLGAYEYRSLRNQAVHGAYSMADELGTPRPKNVTTIKPSGTLSKIMDTTEGVHKPLGRYIFNNVVFGRHDPIIQLVREAGYRVFDNPNDPDSVLVTFPVEWANVPFDMVDGKEVNMESAVTQLERYKLLQDNYCEQNCSNTISYSPDEIPAIVDWIHDNWDSYVGVSFLFRADPTKTAKDLGYLYLPQEVVDKETFTEYVKHLRPVDVWASQGPGDDIDVEECVGGVCPVK